MIISEQWLRSEWVDPALDTEALAHQITMAGLEVDAIYPVAGDFSGVVVAQILSAVQHPDADKLRLCEGDTGSGTVQIVCGAPNARAGLKAPLAQVGAILPGDFKIKKAKLRGVESEGMLCAESELQISDENAGLMELPADAPVGVDLRKYLNLDDHMIEIGLTPNRADCLSVAGIARDIAVLNGQALKGPVIESIPAVIADTFAIDVLAAEHCPRYLGRVIRHVDLARPTPLFVVERLRRAGLRSIDPVVDVTNYVMIELGQPLHAFDLDTLSGGIVVREAYADETMTLLDGSDITLLPGSLLIADHEKPLALAGIMGGENSGVSDTTRHIFLESAFFMPELIAGRARRYGLHTDASHRYERGVDFALQRTAMERATALFLEIVGGEPGPITEVVAESSLPQRNAVNLRAARIRRVLGFDMNADQVERILIGLGVIVTTTDEGWSCIAPSWRFDIAQEVDLIEELARVFGYNNLPVSHIKADLTIKSRSETYRALPSIKQRLAARGFCEAITFSFVSPEQQQMFNPDLLPIALRNPISTDLSVMRTSLIPGLLGVLAHNVKRQASRVRVFETGLRFLPGENLQQVPTIALAMTGNRDAESWSNAAETIDFYDMKGEVEQLLGAESAAKLQLVPCQRAGLHNGQSAEIIVNGHTVGVIARLHPSAASKLDLPAATFVAELDTAIILDTFLPSYEEISKYPEVRRDLALMVDREISASMLSEHIVQIAGEMLEKLVIFDVYEGKSIDPSRKSIAFGLTFRNRSRTLEDTEVTKAISQIVDSLRENFGVELRG